MGPAGGSGGALRTATATSGGRIRRPHGDRRVARQDLAGDRMGSGRGAGPVSRRGRRIERVPSGSEKPVGVAVTLWAVRGADGATATAPVLGAALAPAP